MDGDDAVHAAQVDADAAGRRVDLAFERCAGAERDDRHAVLRTDTHRFVHIVFRFGEDNAVRQLAGNIGGRMRVLLAQCLAGLQFIAETLFQHAKRRSDPVFVSGERF